MDGDSLGNINGRDLKLLGEAELAEGDEILLAEHVVLVLGTHHHRSVLVGRSVTLGALEANLVEEKVGHLDAIIRICLEKNRNSYLFYKYMNIKKQGPKGQQKLRSLKII